MIAVSLVTRGWHSIGSFMFVCALNYKQMELYHAFPFFFYLLGISLQQRGWSAKIGKLMQIGLTVILTFLVIWSPFIMLGQDAVIQVVKRVFPFDRGLFEVRTWQSFLLVIGQLTSILGSYWLKWTRC